MKNSVKLAMLWLALCLPAGAAPRVVVDGRELTFDQPPITEGGRLLVPLRGIFESLGADVVYLPSDRTIRATRGTTRVELPLGSRVASVNGRLLSLDVPARSLGGRTLVPLRFVSEALGAEVSWAAASQTVSIVSQAMPPPVSSAPAPRLSIQSVVHDASRALKPGDILLVTMSGDPGGRATFDLTGVATGIDMREVRPGRYEGTVTIPATTVERATVLVHLENATGLESLQEAARPVTLETRARSTVVSLFPSPNSGVATPRPTVQALFEQPVRPETVRMTLDGVEVTREASVDARMARYVPPMDLVMGLHRASVEAVDYQGNFVRSEWTFTLEPGAAAGLTLTGPTEGATVPRVFHVTGRTMPNSLVRVVGRSRVDLIPGVVGLQGREFEARGYADGAGNFDVRIDASVLPINSSLDLQVVAADPMGRASETVELRLKVR
ncbi:MAG: copper amine oxidase N-terminal domain-containing protein [Candidatus Eremiobacterota bacterium]